MKLRIQSINFDASAALEAYISKKSSKLERFSDDIINVDIYLKVEKPETSDNKEAEIKLTAPNGEFFASKKCDSFEESIDLAVEALEKQIKKFKEKGSKN